MTTTPAMPELPETTYSLFYEEPGDLEGEGCQYVLDDPGYTADQMRAYALATLQAQPAAEVSDGVERVLALAHAYADAKLMRYGQLGIKDLPDPQVAYEDLERAILALRPQSESAAPTVEAAREMGAKGGPVVEAERLAFEAWMAGHCWAVSPTWNGKTYDDSEEDKKRKLLDPLARTTRMLWAAWRDRAALSSLRPQAVPMTEGLVEVVPYSEWRRGDVLRITSEGADIGPFSVGQMVRHDDLDGDNVPYCRSLDGSARYALVHSQLKFISREAHHGITAPAGGEGKA